MRKVGLALMALLAAGWAATAEAQTPAGERVCEPPGSPPPQSMRPPAPPLQPQRLACEQSGRCKKADVERFNAEVSAYNAATNRLNAEGSRYVDALNAWAQSTTAYARCEVDRLNAQVMRRQP